MRQEVNGRSLRYTVHSYATDRPEASRYEELRPWAGLRPATPTGLPVVGRLRGGPSNLLFNTGHGALGFTLAFGSAQRIAAQLAPPRKVAIRPFPAAPAACSA